MSIVSRLLTVIAVCMGATGAEQLSTSRPPLRPRGSSSSYSYSQPTTGAAWREYRAEPIEEAYVFGKAKANSPQGPFPNYSLEIQRVMHRVYRVHVPVRIPWRGKHATPQPALLRYRFTFTSARAEPPYYYASSGDGAAPPSSHSTTATTPWNYKEVALSGTAPATEVVVTSDWLVESDNETWNPTADYLVRMRGEFKRMPFGAVRKELNSSSPRLSSSDLFGGFTSHYYPFVVFLPLSTKCLMPEWPDIECSFVASRMVHGTETYHECLSLSFSRSGDTGVVVRAWSKSYQMPQGMTAGSRGQQIAEWLFPPSSTFRLSIGETTVAVATGMDEPAATCKHRLSGFVWNQGGCAHGSNACLKAY